MILLRNGTLLDGTGRPPYTGNVLIEGDRIAAVGAFDDPVDCRVVDATGLVVCPGFVDLHSHSDLAVLDNRPEKVNQGVTTEVVGNCGFSAFPSGPDVAAQVRDHANGILCGGDDWSFAGPAEYLEAVAAQSQSTQVLPLIGHGSLRVAIAGFQQDPLSPMLVDRLEHTLDDALSAGAAGFSTGLMYAPGSSAPFEELLRLCRITAKHGRIYSTHMRSYSWELLEAIDEQIELARRSGCRLQLSHLQAVGRANWEKQARALDRIDEARGQGIDVAFDCYPYLAGSTVLTQLLPQQELEGGPAAVIGRLSNAATRREIEGELREHTAQAWSDIVISAVETAANQCWVGSTLAEIAHARQTSPEATLIDLVIEEAGRVHIISFNQSEDNLRQLLTHPLASVISDGFYVKGKPHPRLYGTFPFLLGEICRERKWLELPEAVRKITAVPAERAGVRDRGRLAPGCAADVTVFCPAIIGTAATYENPDVPPVGIRLVLSNGRIVLDRVQPAGQQPLSPPDPALASPEPLLN